MIRGKINALGGISAFLGLAGMAEAITDNGSFMVSAIVFAVGFGLCLATMGGERCGRDY